MRGRLLARHKVRMTTFGRRVAVVAVMIAACAGVSQAQGFSGFDASHYADQASQSAMPLQAKLVFGAELGIRSALGDKTLPYRSICGLSYARSAWNANGMARQNDLLTIRFRENEQEFHNLVLQLPPRLAGGYLANLSTRTGLTIGKFRNDTACSAASIVFSTRK